MKGYFKRKLKIKVLYRGKWYYASSVYINAEGFLDIEYCHGLDGCVDSEHLENIIVEEVAKGEKRE